MIETRTFTASDLRTAVTVGVKRDRARIGAIAALPEAVGRQPLAMTLATTTDMTVDQVKIALATAPAAPDVGGDDVRHQTDQSVEQPAADNSANAGASNTAATLWDAALTTRGMKVA